MFDNLFTTYLAAEPPPIVTEDMKLNEENYTKLLAALAPTPSQIPGPIASELPRTSEGPLSIWDLADSYRRRDPLDSTNLSFSDKRDYAQTMYKYLYKALEDNGINGSIWAPILTAHTSIESGWGNEFSRRNNNFAGIKGKGSEVVSTREWSPSRGYYTIQDTFRAYPSVEAFADDYVKKLKNKFKAFNGTPSDYLQNLKNHGYFTARLEDYQKVFNSVLQTVRTYLLDVTYRPSTAIDRDLVSMDIEDLLRQEGITRVNGKPIKFGSKALRAANAPYGSERSHHKERDPLTGNANARDISIVGGTDKDYADFRQMLLNNDRVRNYLTLRRWGIINELTSAAMSRTGATGRHFHFGPDQWARRTWQGWLNNPNTSITKLF